MFAPAGFFMTGKSAEFPAGTTIRGFIDEDVPLTIVPGAAPASTAAPMVVRQ